MIIEGILIVAAIVLAAMVGAGVIIGLLIGARLAARLGGRDEPVFRDKPGMEIEDEDIGDFETT